MYLKINSKKLGQSFDFYMPDRGDYIWVSVDGADHEQICYGGDYRGHTCYVSRAAENIEKSFRKECRDWYRDHVKLVEKFGAINP